MLKEELTDQDYSIYMLFFDLLPLSREAHVSEDEKVLRKIYGFSEWCLNQSSGEVSNAAGVAFYEHLLDVPDLRSKVIPWLSPNVIAIVRPLWAERLEVAEFDQLERSIRNRKTAKYRELDVE